MSDDSLGGFGPTTPAHAIIKSKAATAAAAARIATKTTKPTQVRSTTDQDPGPSKRPAGNTAKRPAKRRKEEEEEVVVQTDDDDNDGGAGKEAARVIAEEVIVASSDEDEVRVEIENRVNGKTKARANGRAQQQQQKGKSLPKKVMEVEASEEESGEEGVVYIDPQPSQVPKNGRGSRTNAATVKEKAGKGVAQARREKASATDLGGALGDQEQDAVAALIEKAERPSKPDARKDAEITRLKEKISELEKENRTLANQMEELCRVRETEAEALLHRTEEQCEAKVRVLEEMTQSLTAQLTKKQPLAGTGKSSILHIITREVAEEERQVLDREIAKLKGDLDDVTKKLSLKDQETVELKQTQEELRVELKAEIERANTLAKQTSRHPQPTPRSGLVAEDPKHREAIKLYEDLTNIIILNVRSTPGPLKKDEWVFMCCYTHTNETDSVTPTTHSLSFTLHSYETTSDDQPTDWIQYLPMSLDKESPDYVEKLGFLSAAFLFERNQLALFLRTLYTTVEDIVKGGRDSEDGEEDEEMVLS